MYTRLTRNLALHFLFCMTTHKANDMTFIWKLFWITDDREMKEESSLLTYSSKDVVKEDEDNLWILTMFIVYQLKIMGLKINDLKEKSLSKCSFSQIIRRNVENNNLRGSIPEQLKNIDLQLSFPLNWSCWDILFILKRKNMAH